MVRAANVKRAAAEKRFKEANNKVGEVLVRLQNGRCSLLTSVSTNSLIYLKLMRGSIKNAFKM